MSAPLVTAIVVAHDGARWLGETLSGVLGQSRPADRVVGADNGSRDGSADLLERALGAGNVLRLPRSTGFGAAVAEVLGKLEAAPGEWIWLLHDDCAPDPHALRHLLMAAERDPKAAVLGPKLRDWMDRRLLVEVGVTVDRSGRRDTGLEPREYDQGQYDGDRDVLSVSSAGMLVRRDVWAAVGGIDPALELFRDDLDLCWRVRNAGHRVVNVRRAVAYHAEAAARRRRRITASGDHPRRLDRRNAMFVVMANLPFAAMLWALVRNVLGSVVATLLFVVAKQPANAYDEVAALGSVLLHPGRLIKARRARKPGRKQGYFAIKKLLTPRGAAYRRLTDLVQGFLAGEGPVESAGRHHAVVAPPSEEDEIVLDDSGFLRRFLSRPGVLLTLALTVIALVAERNVLGGSLLGGGALVPVVGGAADLWRFYLEAFHDTGLGSSAWAPPYVAVVAAVSTLFLGKTWLAVSVLLLGSVPLAGASAYLATRRIIPAVPARIWLAAGYALLPVATGAIAAGRLGTAVVFVLLPVYAGLGVQLLSAEPRRARRAGWGLGLLLAVGTAFAPLVYVLLAVLGVLAMIAFGRVRQLATALAVPPVLLFPWLRGFADHPGQLLLEAGLHRSSLIDPALAPHALLTFSPGGPGLPPFWVTAGLIATALAALLFRRQRMIVAIGWGIALYGVLVAILVSRVTVTSAAGGEAARAWPGIPLALAATGLLVLVALTAHRLAELRAAGGLRRLVAVVVVAVAFSTPVLAAAFWIASGTRGPLSGSTPDPMPALAEGTRTLLLRGESFTVLHRRTPLLGEAELPVREQVRDRVARAAAGLVAGRGGTDAATLAALGISHVAVAEPAPEVAKALDSQPQLNHLSLTEREGVWRLVEPPARVPAPPEDPLRLPMLWAQAALTALVLVLAAPGARTADPLVVAVA
ncbi:glycosyltransferase family 2 protein [Nonomuraea africana]|uniref:glycosyltransferase family 2 protein n=1 Tax=Nonomuraea africana TaxID=46171 RepID=UPI00340DF91D